MPHGKKSSGSTNKPSQKQRRAKRARNGLDFNPYVVPDNAPNLIRLNFQSPPQKSKREFAVGAVNDVNPSVSPKGAPPKRLRPQGFTQTRSPPNAQEDTLQFALKIEAPHTAPAVTVKREIKEESDEGEDDSIEEICKSEWEDEDQGEDDDNDDHGHDMTQLSHDMAKFLRHTAYDDGVLDEDDWIALPCCCAMLRRTEDEVTTAVKLSDRTPPTPTWYEFDSTPHDARFELRHLGSRSWIRATDGDYYRGRIWTKEGWMYERED
jgi:hypothetical protein